MPSSSRSSGSSKKIIVYAIIGVVAVAAVSGYVFARPPNGNEQAALQRFQEQWCGPGAKANSDAYVSEVVLQSNCEMPLGLAVDGNSVWYVSTKRGYLVNYNTEDSKFNEYKIPVWPSLDRPYTSVPSWQSSWTVRLDSSGNVWFTDERNTIWRFNKTSGSFDMFKVPAKYPSDMEFDKNDNIYFIGIDSHSLFFGDVSKMKKDTSEGITEIPLPLEGFNGIDLDIVTSGLLVVDNARNDVWVSQLAFQQRGELFQYDIDTNKVIRTVDLPASLSSPVGATLDNSGNLWVADHGSNIFYKYDSATQEITKFTTSIASPKIYGGATTPQNAYTWPYWVTTGPDGSIWFNEHIGNKIARFDPEALTLTEYWVPTQNDVWAACPQGSQTCGIANAIQLTVSPDNQVWFSEWTQNKIAKVDTAKQVPTVSAPEEVTVARGDSAEIKVTFNGDFSGRMVSSATFTPNGMLGNSSGIFSEESVSTSGGSKQVSYTFTAADSLVVGQYTIMVGAENDDITVMKAVKVNIV